MKPLLIGMAPGAGAPADGSVHRPIGPAFVGTPSGTRLARLVLGLESSFQLPWYFDLVNLLRFPGWNQQVANIVAPAVVARTVVGRHRSVVLFGAGVAEAMGLSYHPLYEWHHLHTGVTADPSGVAVDPAGARWVWRAAVMPHPSGAVLHWNDPANRRQGGEFLWGLVNESEEVVRGEQRA